MSLSSCKWEYDILISGQKLNVSFFDLTDLFRPMKYISEIWNENGLYGSLIFEELVAIENFLQNHPTEIVILHFNHGWQGMDETDFKRLNNHLT